MSKPDIASNIMLCVQTNIGDAATLMLPNPLPGMLVPSATKAMALTESFMKMKQPKWPATSLMTAVMKAIMAMDRTKVP